MSKFATRNAHGVYEDRDVVELPNGKPKWRGCALAEIRVANTPDGWRSSMAFCFTTGSAWGHAEPISDRNQAFPTRDAAIAHASARLRLYIAPARMGHEASSMERERRAILAWLDLLQPAQLDLLALL